MNFCSYRKIHGFNLYRKIYIENKKKVHFYPAKPVS